MQDIIYLIYNWILSLYEKNDFAQVSKYYS